MEYQQHVGGMILVALLSAAPAANCAETLQVEQVKKVRSSDLPEWVVRPQRPQYRTFVEVKFNAPVNTSTVIPGRTFFVEYQGHKTTGPVYWSPYGLSFIYHFDKEDDEIYSPGAGENVILNVRISGSKGQITDNDGKVWPFSGVYRKPVNTTPGLPGQGSQPLNYAPKDLLDGDADGSPGGEYRKSIFIVG